MKPIVTLASFLLLALTAVSAPGEEPPAQFATLKLTTGDTYRDASVMRAEADALVVMHSGGVARVPFERVPARIREAYDFDPEAAERARRAYRNKWKARRQARLEAAAEKATRDRSECRTFLVHRVIDEGLLVHIHRRDGPSGRIARSAALLAHEPGSNHAPPKTGQRIFLLTEVPTEGIADGDIVEVRAFRVENTYTYDPGFGPPNTVHIYEFVDWQASR